MPAVESQFVDPNEQPASAGTAAERVRDEAVEIAMTPPKPRSPPLEEGEPAESVIVSPPEKPTSPEAPTVTVEQPKAEKETNPEEKRPNDYHAALHEKWEAAFYKKREEEKQRFDTIHVQASQLLPDDNSRKALGHSADILKWSFWADYEDPLPAGLKLEVDDREKVTKLGLNKDLVTPDIFNNSRALLNECGLSDLTEKIQNERFNTRKEVVPELAEAINDLPLTKAIATVATVVDHKETEAPLSETSKMVERSKLQNSIQHATRGESTHAAHRTDIGHALYKSGDFKIDMQTEQRPDEKSSNRARWERVRSFIHDAADRQPDRSYNDTASSAANYLRGSLTTTQDLDDVTLQFTTGWSIMKNLLNADTREDFDRAFATARKKAAEDMLMASVYGMIPPYTRADEYTSGLEKQFWVHQPKTTYAEEYSATYKIDAAETALSEAADKRLKWQENSEVAGEIGTVLQGSLAVEGKMLRYTVGEVADFTNQDIPEEAVVIRAERSRGRVPNIPGMQLLGSEVVSPTEDLYYFLPTPNEDPHAPCLVSLPRNKLHELAKIYHQLGLVDLASDLQSLASPTVFDLQNLLARNSVYPETDHNMSYSVASLDDCRVFVKNGKLSAQCTGSATFLWLSLDEIFEDECPTSFIVGHLLNGGKVNADLHRQVGIILDGALYYLDAGASADLTAIQPNTSLTPPRIKATPNEQSATQKKLEHILRSSDPAGLHRIFQQSLSRAYNHPRFDPEKVDQTIVQLSAIDPTFRTYTISHRAAKYGLTDEIKGEIRALRAYIAGIQSAQTRQDTRALAGNLRPYLQPETSSLLQVLDTHLKQYLD